MNNYNKHRRKYFASGGKIQVRKYQNSGYLPGIPLGIPTTEQGIDYDQFSPVSSPATGGKKSSFKNILNSTTGNDGASFFDNKENIGALGSMIGTGLTSLSREPATKPGGKYVQSATRHVDSGEGFTKGANAALGIAATFDPTGTSQIVKGALDLGKGASNLIKNKDEYGISQSGTQEVIGNVLDPIGRIQDSINHGKRYGTGEGLKNWATFGVSGRNTLKDSVSKAKRAEDIEEANLSYGMNKGDYRNDGIYAQKGAYLEHVPRNIPHGKPDAEIEDGELIIGNPRAVNTIGNVGTSMESDYAVKVHGDKHGQDTDNDGMEGIPVQSKEDVYIASDYLGVDGKKAGKGNPTVAKKLEPNVNFLHQAQKTPEDPYKNNPIAIALQKKQIEKTINEAERNKFKQEIAKVAKKKNTSLEDIVEVLKQMPQQNITPDEKLILESAIKSNQQSEQSGMLEQLAGKQQQQMGFNSFRNKMGGYSRRYQMGGEMPMDPSMMGGEGEEQDPSGAYMQELAGQAPGMNQMGMEEAGAPMLSPEAEEMFNMLPPEQQEMIAQLPPEQMEPAIFQAFEQMQGGMGEMGPEMGGDPGMMGDPMMQGMEGDMGGMGMEDPGMAAEQAALMKMGGRMGMPSRDLYKSGGAMKKGCKVKYKMGGRMMEGTFRGYDKFGAAIID